MKRQWSRPRSRPLRGAIRLDLLGEQEIQMRQRHRERKRQRDSDGLADRLIQTSVADLDNLIFAASAIYDNNVYKSKGFSLIIVVC